MVVLEEKQYSCDGGEGKAIQPCWCWRRSNTAVVVLEEKQYSCHGGERKGNTAVVVLEG